VNSKKPGSALQANIPITKAQTTPKTVLDIHRVSPLGALAFPKSNFSLVIQVKVTKYPRFLQW
jgi:hypothetical protein